MKPITQIMIMRPKLVECAKVSRKKGKKALARRFYDKVCFLGLAVGGVCLSNKNSLMKMT